MFQNFTGNTKERTINLGTNSTTSSAASLIAKARAERQQRERLRVEATSAELIQRVWRGTREAGRVKRQLVGYVKEGKIHGIDAARALSVVYWKGFGIGNDRSEREEALAILCRTPNTIFGELNTPTDPSTRPYHIADARFDASVL